MSDGPQLRRSLGRFVSPTLARLAFTPDVVVAHDPAGKGHFMLRRVTVNGTPILSGSAIATVSQSPVHVKA